MENFTNLLKEVGRPYEMFNEDGTYQGCIYTEQILYPDKQRNKLRSNDDDKNYNYGLAKLKQHCEEISLDELKKGDIIATRFNDELHVAVFYEFDKIIHVFRGHTLQISRLKIFRNKIRCFRVI